jgi:hypothetical protein
MMGGGGKNRRLVRNWNHNSKGISTLMIKSYCDGIFAKFF